MRADQLPSTQQSRQLTFNSAAQIPRPWPLFYGVLFSTRPLQCQLRQQPPDCPGLYLSHPVGWPAVIEERTVKGGGPTADTIP
jgi:hypothetical protein